MIGKQECKSARIKLMSTSDKWRNILHCATIKFILRHKADSVTLFQIKDWIKIIKEFPWSVQIYLDCELWCLNFDNTGYIGRDSGRKKRVKVGVGGESWGYIRISQYQEKQFSPTLCSYSIAVLVIFWLMWNLLRICDVWKNRFSLRASSWRPRRSQHGEESMQWAAADGGRVWRWLNRWLSWSWYGNIIRSPLQEQA